MCVEVLVSSNANIEHLVVAALTTSLPRVSALWNARTCSSSPSGSNAERQHHLCCMPSENSPVAREHYRRSHHTKRGEHAQRLCCAFFHEKSSIYSMYCRPPSPSQERPWGCTDVTAVLPRTTRVRWLLVVTPRWRMAYARTPSRGCWIASDIMNELRNATCEGFAYAGVCGEKTFLKRTWDCSFVEAPTTPCCGFDMRPLL